MFFAFNLWPCGGEGGGKGMWQLAYSHHLDVELSQFTLCTLLTMGPAQLGGWGGGGGGVWEPCTLSLTGCDGRQ
jgi:hypothetical protein